MFADKHGSLLFNPDDKNTGIKIKIDKSTTKNCVEGTKVLVSIGKELGDNYYVGHVIKELGHINDPGIDIKSIAYKYFVR